MFAFFLRDILYLFAAVLLSPLVLYRRFVHGRYRDGWAERFGAAPCTPEDRIVIWVHAVSVGEVNAAATLVTALAAQFPDRDVVISVTTDTGMARARTLYGKSHRVFYFPWDFSFAVKRAFKRLRPAACILMEGEVWPNFMAVAARHGIPVAVANARVGSDKGWPRYQRLRLLLRPMFARLTRVIAQDATHAARFRHLGVPPDRVRVVGSLKYDTAATSNTVKGANELAAVLGLSGGGSVWVCGSTGPGEETLLLEVYRGLRRVKGLEKIRLVLVPRKPERFEEVAALIATEEFKLIRYSRIKSGQHGLGGDYENAVILGDTMGDLRKFYALADVIFVGRSLVPMGGSDMLEAVALGKPVVVGPYTDNFMDVVQKLVAAGGLEIVPDRLQLQLILRDLLIHPRRAAALARAGRQTVLENRGATRRTLAILNEVIPDA